MSLSSISKYRYIWVESDWSISPLLNYRSHSCCCCHFLILPFFSLKKFFVRYFLLSFALSIPTFRVAVLKQRLQDNIIARITEISTTRIINNSWFIHQTFKIRYIFCTHCIEQQWLSTNPLHFSVIWISFDLTYQQIVAIEFRRRLGKTETIFGFWPKVLRKSFLGQFEVRQKNREFTDFDEFGESQKVKAKWPN